MPQLLPYFLVNCTMREINQDNANISTLVYIVGGIGVSWICLIILRSDNNKHNVSPHFSKYSIGMNICMPLVTAMFYIGIKVINDQTQRYLENHPGIKPKDLNNSTIQLYLFLIKFFSIFTGIFGLTIPIITYERILSLVPSKTGSSIVIGMVNAGAMAVGLLITFTIIVNRLYFDPQTSDEQEVEDIALNTMDKLDTMIIVQVSLNALGAFLSFFINY